MDGYPVQWLGSWAIVTLPAEVDLSNAGRLLEQLLLVIDGGATDLVADMSATTFCDSSGVHALVRARSRLDGQGGRLHVVAGSASVLRLFDLVGLSTLITIQATLAAALRARESLAAGEGPAGTADVPPPPHPRAGTEA